MPKLDDALFKAPAFAARVLEVEIGVVDAMRGDAGERPGQRRVAEAEGLKQQRSCNGEAFDRGFAGNHERAP
jgi:hypothetical protein